jgi:molybdate transport system substrate-binding protein
MLNHLLKTLIIFALLSQPVIAVEKVLLYAAASTSNAITEIINQFNKDTPEFKVKVSFASSSTLAKQIDAGAPAHVYISANPKWMDYLQERKLIINESRQDLLHNKIVLIAPLESQMVVEMSKKFDFSAILKGRLCLGDPSHVPVGIYAKQALISMGWWEQIKTKIVGAKDVRAALVFVERGECDAGIVYSTDASASKKSKILTEFPADTHKPIIYPVATLASAPDSAKTFLTYLSSSQAQAIFKKHGFSTN